ncbi:MAG: IS21-like element helper ATPase IstB [Acidimicrobiales bacterium]
MTSPSPYEQLKDDLGYLGLDAAAECFATLAEEAMTNDWPPVTYLEAVIAAQATSTRNRRLSARLRFARFPSRKTIEEFDFSFQPSVDRKLVMDLATLRFVTAGRPVLFLGQPGCGKSHLATALAILAVEAGYRGYFSSADEMVRNLGHALLEGTFNSKLKTYVAPSVLVIDDVGLIPMARAEATAFFQVVNRRYEVGHSTIVTTNRGLPEWGEILGDPVVAAAILDRLMHRAVVFNIKGPSWRMREHQALATASSPSEKDTERRRR